MNKKRILSSVLAVVCLIGLFSGCEKKGSGVIKWSIAGTKPTAYDAVMAKVNEYVEPELGVKLEIEYLGSSALQEQTKLRMASGEAIDLVFTSNWLNDYHTLANLGGLYDLTDLIDNIEMKDGTTASLNNVIDSYYMEGAKIKGKIYGIPNIQVASNPGCLVMEKPIADESGVNMAGLQETALKVKDAETSKVYMDMLSGELAKVKAKRPDLTTINPTSFNTVATENIYETLVGGIALRRDGISDKLVILADTPEYQYGIDTLNKWYNAGYIRNDIASKGAAMASIDEERLHAVTWNTWKPGQDVYFKAQRENTEPVYSFISQPYVKSTAPLSTMISVGATTNYPEECVKLIYMLNSNKDMFNALNFGIEGENYNVNADGTVTEIPDSGWNLGKNAWKMGNQFNSFVMEGQPLDVWEQTKKMNDDAPKSPAIGFVPDTTKITTELANITNVEAEYNARINFGTTPRSEYWEEYRSKLETAGIQKVLDELQKQYDEFLASK